MYSNGQDYEILYVLKWNFIKYVLCLKKLVQKSNGKLGLILSYYFREIVFCVDYKFLVITFTVSGHGYTIRTRNEPLITKCLQLDVP